VSETRFLFMVPLLLELLVLMEMAALVVMMLMSFLDDDCSLYSLLREVQALL
jgi:hypothetical protein